MKLEEVRARPSRESKCTRPYPTSSNSENPRIQSNCILRAASRFCDSLGAALSFRAFPPPEPLTPSSLAKTHQRDRGSKTSEHLVETPRMVKQQHGLQRFI